MDSQKSNLAFSVIPAKAGIQYFHRVVPIMDPRFHGDDDFCDAILFERLIYRFIKLTVGSLDSAAFGRKL
jgi:hypothetical protein